MDKNIGVVYCLGENLQEREEGKVKEVLENQVNEVLPGKKPRTRTFVPRL